MIPFSFMWGLIVLFISHTVLKVVTLDKTG